MTTKAKKMTADKRKENPWEEYERRKAEIRKRGLSGKAYAEAIRALADELNI